jgi:erythromycin esterase
LETLKVILSKGKAKKLIVWAHNTHIGDFRATDMVLEGLVNLGGLARQEFGREKVALVGFSTFQGTVTASHAWDGPIETLEVPPAKEDSLEAALHELSAQIHSPEFYLIFDDEIKKGTLSKVIGHRAIGVVYDPRHEKRSNYVPSVVAQRYDALYFVDQSTALSPLIQSFQETDIPETYPVGQ